jgi:hypothetical protein
MSDLKKEVSTLMSKVRQKGFPSSEQIVTETFKKLGYLPGRVPPQIVQQNFNMILRHVWTETLGVLEHYEKEFYPSSVIDALLSLKEDVFVESQRVAHTEGYGPAVKFLFSRLYPYLREVFLSIA